MKKYTEKEIRKVLDKFQNVDIYGVMVKDAIIKELFGEK